MRQTAMTLPIVATTTARRRCPVSPRRLRRFRGRRGRQDDGGRGGGGGRTRCRACMYVSFIQVARKLAMVEADLERAEERAEAGES